MDRRNALGISILLALGVGAIIAAVIATDDSVDDVSVGSNPAIVELIPPRGDTILPQSNVGVILASGWSGELTYIDNVQIPLNEQRIERALNSIIFRPDENLSLERLPTQEVCAQIRYWEVRSPDLVQFFSWCFRVDG
ncbi:MAG: hypothetical protein MB54_05795 [marine actinobacterium MedAcidi-G2B]|nr:MAG: hypothetical protein MB54_05795 [marine actinobacterium MedAcidi-G2B]